MVDTAITTNAARFLSEYTFRKVWNSVKSEYRSNFKLGKIGTTFCSSIVPVGNITINLPTSGQYLAFAFPWNSTNGALSKPLNNVWMSGSDILTRMGALVEVYTINGNRIPLRSFWILHLTDVSTSFLIIEKAAVVRCTGANKWAQDFYMTVYRDPERDTPLTCRSYESSSSTSSAILADYAQTTKAYPNQTTVFVNGYEWDPTQGTPKLGAGDFLELLVDMDILGCFTVDVDSKDTGYQSVKYNGYREVLHIPKSLGVSQYIITNDSMTVFLRDQTTNRGVYFHRLNENGVRQVTHNDISLDRFTIDAFKSALGAPLVSARVQVRRQKKTPRLLMREANYLSDLYTLDDATIVGHLRGQIDNTLDFWSAASIEQSPYITMMFQNTEGADGTLDSFVNGLGYYTTASILSANVFRGVYTNASMTAQKPFVLRGVDCYPLVFVDGLKINNDYVKYTNTTGEVAINFYAGAGVSVGKEVVVILIEDGSNTPIILNSQTNQNRISSPDENVTVYQQVSGAFTDLDGTKLTTGYALVAPSLNTYEVLDNTDHTGWDVQFKPATYGNTYITQPTRYTNRYATSIDDLIAARKVLAIPLHERASDNSIIPLLGLGTKMIFLNGYKLVEGIDFDMQPLTDTNGVTYAQYCMIMNREYLKASGNIVEIIIHSGQNISSDLGYVIANVLQRESVPSLYYDDVSGVWAEGKIIDEPVDHGVWMAPQSPLPNGSVYEIHSNYPSVAFDIMDGYSNVQDIKRVTALDTYLGRSRPQAPAVIPITGQHGVYSTYITAIAYDVNNGLFTAVNDPNPTTFLGQFSGYDIFFQRDPTMKNNGVLDRRFVSVAACYGQITSASPEIAIILRKLIQLTLVKSDYVIEETLA